MQIQLIYRIKNFYSNTRFEITVRGNAPLSDYDFSYLRLLMQHYQSLGNFEWRQRFFGQIASGSNVPHESALFLASGNPEEMMQNPLTRASGIIPRSSMVYRNNVNTFQFAGGLNIRGYAGYLVPELVNNKLIYRYRGIHGVSSNTELSLKKWIRYKWTQAFSIDPYLFHDMGIIGDGNIKNNINFSNLKMSSGAGFLFSVNKYPFFETLKAFQLRLDFPLFLNSTPFVSPENLKFRYVLGINAMF
jgi:aminopeptidase N